ncbi:hypothetical protein NBRC10512_005596 [Rhodotorula toruloides]|uniref:RHTO0S15e01816g1_1 n=2 Tax=Rhodotorula toruloides TaxID=5286 RepID=A0A061BIR3_RHOTO|nr:uncharacterized protein RHTO_03225 [Rhodotorula toruloides NP11]EMS25496.1 hypothetical protein RHTO_03225 [Rhodotorula toruloides NP11]CDR47784.1 RHTO0S15e01816g1_1 [Rhodotorula toruloides]
MTARQTFEVGSQWPLYAPEVYFELAMLRCAAEQGFQPGKLTKRRTDKRMTGKIYEIGCLHPSCPFSVSLHDSIKLAECVTSDVRLAHNHPLVVGNGPSAKELEKAEGKVMAAAKTELARLRAPAGYREGIEKEEAEDVLWPSCEQECVLWDLRDVWGEERAREWERAFREEGLLASDYPNPSTFDGPHPLTGPRAKRLPGCGAKPPVKVDFESQKPGEDRQLRRRKPDAPKKTFPKLSSSEDEEDMQVKVGKKRVVHVTPPTVPPFLQSTKSWDLKAFEQSLEAYTRANGFSTKKCSSNSPRLAYTCTVVSCGWQVVLKPQFGIQEWLVDDKASVFAHRHEAGAGNGKVKPEVEKKPAANHGDPSTFRLPPEYKLPVSKIDVDKVAVRYEDGSDDEFFAIDPRVPHRNRKKLPPKPGRGKSIPPPFVPAPAFNEIEDEPKADRSPTFVAQPPTPDSPAYAIGAPAAPVPPYFAAAYPQPAPWYGYSPQQYPSSHFQLPHWVPPAPQTPAYTHAAPPYSPYPIPLAQPVQPITQPITLEEYLADLDQQGLFEYSAYAPALRRAGVNEPAQLERLAEKHLDKVETALRRADHTDELLLEAFIDDLRAAVDEKQARSKRSEAPSWVKESQ